MRTCLAMLSAAALVLPLSLGCKPQPVVDQPPADQPPATESTDTTPSDEKASVDVEAGGGQGVQVDVNEPAPQQ